MDYKYLNKNLIRFFMTFSVIYFEYSEVKAGTFLCKELYSKTTAEPSMERMESASISRGWIAPSYLKSGVVVLLKNLKGQSMLLIGSKDSFPISSEELSKATHIIFSPNDVKQLDPKRSYIDRILMISLEHAMDSELKDLYFTDDNMVRLSSRILRLQKNNKIVMELEQ